MSTFFLVCALLGGTALVLQLVLSLFGVVEGHDLEGVPHDHPAADGLDLFSVRALAAGLAFFGVGGLFGLWLPLGTLAAWPIALVAGYGAMRLTATAIRAMSRLEADGTVLTEEAIGEQATVYLGIPAQGEGRGKVHLLLRGRLTELDAVSRGDAIPTGAAVMVTDVIEGDTLVVAPTTLVTEGDAHAR